MNEVASAPGGALDPGAGAVLVRRATANDAEAIAVLQDLANEGHLSAYDWAWEGRDWRRVGAERIAANDTEMGLAWTIVAERGGAVVGMLNYAEDAATNAPDDVMSRPFIALRERLSPCLYLRAMAVLEGERGGGVGRRLLDVALAAARADAGRAVGVIVHEHNASLIGHYERRGFGRVATEPVVAHHAYPKGSLLIGLRLEGAGEGTRA